MIQTSSQAASSIGRWKTYPTYKDSGVEWLGEIPEHWEVKRLKFVCQISPSKSDIAHFPLDMEVSFLPMERIGEDGTIALEETRLIEQVRQGYTYFRDGDVIVAKITPCFENGKGALCHSLVNGIGFGSTELYVLRPKKENEPKFIYYLTKSEMFRVIGAAMMQGAAGQQRVPAEFVSNFQIGFPPFPEQRAIATFLDHETTRINALIAKKERMIELLREKRTALISHAVTKGLDPTVQMKDSGVEWLGEIPEGWEVRRLKNVIQNGLVNGLFKKKDQYGSGTKLVNVTDLYNDNFLINFADLGRVEAEQEEHETFKVLAGDIFFVRSSLKLEGVGSSACIMDVPEPTVFECHVVRIRPSSKLVIPKYLINYFNSSLVRQRLVALAETTTMTTISQPKLASLEVVVPSLAEQLAIIDYLDHETTKIDALISRIREGIEKLKEYSTALISAAVMGKIDVRGVAIEAKQASIVTEHQGL